MASPLFLAFSLLPIRLPPSAFSMSSCPFFSPHSRSLALTQAHSYRHVLVVFPGTQCFSERKANLPKGIKEKKKSKNTADTTDTLSVFHCNAILCRTFLCCLCLCSPSLCVAVMVGGLHWIVLDCPPRLCLFWFQHSPQGLHSLLFIIFHWFLI